MELKPVPKTDKAAAEEAQRQAHNMQAKFD